MTQTPSSRRICLIERGATDTPFLTIDVFPHRVDLKPGYSIKDLLIWAMSISVFPLYKPEISSEIRYHWQNITGIISGGLESTFADIRAGAFAVAPDEASADDLVLIYDSGNVHLPCGQAIPIGEFYYGATETAGLHQTRQGQISTLTERCKNNLPTQMRLALISASLPAKPDILAHGQPLEAAFARIANKLDLGYAAGAAGTQRAAQDMSNELHRCLNTPLLIPDRLYGPSSVVATQDFTTIVQDHVPDALMQIAREALLQTTSVRPDLLLKAAKTKKGELAGANFHEELKVRQALTALDEAIERAAPLDLLRSAPRRRQEKLRAA